jgi:UDP-N-acetylglucosamine--N-acetylmuramyl-(pentapeptide) pyrophosphoryl-undecaprenol N-acetylglucosamine transferase
VNAQFLASQQAAWLIPQQALTAQVLADFLLETDRQQLLQAAQNAYLLRKTSAALDVVTACEEVSV